jgi:hypothetical protein
VIVSPQESNNPLEVSAPVRVPASARRKAKPDIYTVLLVIALLAVILGIVFLWLYNADYGWNFKGVGMAGAERSAFSGRLCAADAGDRETASGKFQVPRRQIVHPSSLISYLPSFSEHGCSRTC